MTELMPAWHAMLLCAGAFVCGFLICFFAADERFQDLFREKLLRERQLAQAEAELARLRGEDTRCISS